MDNKQINKARIRIQSRSIRRLPEQKPDCEKFRVLEGPRFRLGTTAESILYTQEIQLANQSKRYERGRNLTAAFRCDACHGQSDLSTPALNAPDLSQLSVFTEGQWIVKYLMENHQRPQLNASRRMPMFKLSKPKQPTLPISFSIDRVRLQSKQKAEQQQAKGFESKRGRRKKRTGGSATKKDCRGKKLFIETGCLACHPSEGIGKATLFGGTDLTGIANKRKANFFEKWLKTPEKINKNHRMPQFNLNGKQIAELSSYLKTLRVKSDEEQYAIDPSNRESVARGETLLAKLNCNRCHSPEDKQRPLKTKENAEPCFSSIARKHENRFQPQYIVSESDELAIETYLTENANRQTLAPKRTNRARSICCPK